MFERFFIFQINFFLEGGGFNFALKKLFHTVFWPISTAAQKIDISSWYYATGVCRSCVTYGDEILTEMFGFNLSLDWLWM